MKKLTKGQRLIRLIAQAMDDRDYGAAYDAANELHVLCAGRYPPKVDVNDVGWLSVMLREAARDLDALDTEPE